MELIYMPWKLRASAQPFGRNAPYFEVVAETPEGDLLPVPGFTMVGASWSRWAEHVVEAHNYWLQEGGDLG